MGKNFNFQNIGTLLAMFISVIALVTSIYEANILKSQQKAMVWPYLNFTQYTNSDGFNVRILNNGTGPAILKSIEISYDNKPLKDLGMLFSSLDKDHNLGYDQIRAFQFAGYVLRPGEEKEIFALPWTDKTRRMAAKMNDVTIMVYYESVLGDGWVYDSSKGTNKPGKFKARVEYSNTL